MNKRIQLRTVNKAIAHMGIELVKGEGYFYFFPLDPAAPMLDNATEYVYALNHISLSEWVHRAENVIADNQRD